MRLFRSVSCALISSTVALSLLSPVAMAANLTYSVSAGDSLWKLAKTYGTTVEQIKGSNGLNSDVIYTGQTLDIPTTQTAVAGASTAAPQKHSVVAGDNLWTLARTYGTTVDRIKSDNKLSSDVIYIGQTLTLPGIKTTNDTTISSRSDLNRDDVMLVARMIEAEAGGEAYQGKLAVGAVIMNRVKSSQFPNTVKGVLYQDYQFEPVSNGYIWKVTPSADSIKAAEQAVSGVDPTGGALFFYNPSKAYSGFLASKPVIYSVGGHVFSK